MVHQPCGKLRPVAPCNNEDGVCRQGYPRDPTATTTIQEDNYPVYRRRDDGRRVINQNVVFDSSLHAS